MLSAMTSGSLASSPMILSAGGHDEHPCEVKSSTTARGSAWAGRMTAMIATSPRALDQREKELWAIIAVIANHAPASTHPSLGASARRLIFHAHCICTRIFSCKRFAPALRQDLFPFWRELRSFGFGPCQNAKKAALLLGRPHGARYSLRSE